MKETTIPFNNVSGRNMPNPRSVIQIAVSDSIGRSMSPEEIARHICASLYNILYSNEAVIGCDDNSELLLFEEKHQDSQRG